ncbi:MAG: Gfo/Idh/MocA family oxidoreductase [Clostridia bacterium]|nr:Gfo/Idh/MocA family oxidoreductase [Clostridia bacterium]
MSEQKRKLTVAISGLGSRGFQTYAKLCAHFPDDLEIVAGADPNPDHMRLFRERFDLPDDRCFSSSDDLLSQDKLADILLICTLDRLHFSEAIAALEKGYDILLEKPISTNAEECKIIADTANRLGRKVMVCHVLRYTVFYQTLKQRIENGDIGDVMSIQAMERVCYWHQAHSFVRGNWRNSETTSSMILQKCCHDMDIYLWLAGKECEAVSSFGDRTYFCPAYAPEGAKERCSETCSAFGTCVYNPYRYYGNLLKSGSFGWPLDVVISDPSEEKLEEALRNGPYGKCVFLNDNNVVDHQVVNLLLKGGATVSFTMSAFTATPGRTMNIMGTKGNIEASMDEFTIDVCPFGGEKEHIDVRTLTDDFAGHGGGDGRMMQSMIRYFRDGILDNAVTTIDRSVESHYVAMAAEESRQNGGEVVRIADFVDRIGTGK